MESMQKDHQIKEVKSEEEGLLLMQKSPLTLTALLMSLKTAFELELFDLIAKADGGQLSAAEIAGLLPTENPQAPEMLDRILRLLASASYVTCTLINDKDDDYKNKKLYKLTPLGQLLVRNEQGASPAQLVDLIWCKAHMDSWYYLKEAILEGGVPFERAHGGMNSFQYAAKDSRYNEVFNKAMFSNTTMIMKRLVEVYHGFEGLKELVDVGGGIGATIAAVVSKYPNIRAINYDLPHVIQKAAPLKGVEHIGGDMFESVPVAEAILMKGILHDWSDDQCLKILRNCFKALSKTGKLILVENILPEYPDGAPASNIGFHLDVAMMVWTSGGKERTQKEWEILAITSGFSSIKPICPVYHDWVIEFYK